MPVSKKLLDYLDSNDVRYETLRHSQAFTAQEIAARAHISGWKVAKTVLVRAADKLLMVVLPAPAKVDLESLADALGTPSAKLASEDDFRGRFPDCEVGAMPPFGNLYDMPVCVDESLRQDQNIAFNAGTHRELVRIAYADFDRLVQPRHIQCAVAA